MAATSEIYRIIHCVIYYCLRISTMNINLIFNFFTKYSYIVIYIYHLYISLHSINNYLEFKPNFKHIILKSLCSRNVIANYSLTQKFTLHFIINVKFIIFYHHN